MICCLGLDCRCPVRRLGVSDGEGSSATLGDANSELGVEHKGRDDFFTAHFGPSEGGDKSEGEPEIRGLALNPPCFVSAAARRLSIFRTSLLRPRVSILC